MTFNSIYEFFQIYFKYNLEKENNQIKFFNWAIRDTNKIIDKTFVFENFEPIDKYSKNKFVNNMTENFLIQYKKIMVSMYPNTFKELKLKNSTLKINKSKLSSNRRGIKISFKYLYHEATQSIIIILYSNSSNISKEFEILKAIIKESEFHKSLPIYDKISFWDLSTGKISKTFDNKIKDIDFNDIKVNLNSI